jgi:membrane associated rhomboid family serine protease
MGGGWLAVNLIIAVVGGGLLPGAGSAGVAWEAHLTGFLMGVLLIGPLARLAPKDHLLPPN